MPTNDRLSLTAALAWLRAQVDRLRRSVMARRPVVRWGVALVALIGLTSAVYWAATSFSTLGVRYLVSGRRFSSDDLIKVCRTLDKQRVGYRVDDLRRVEVAADQFDQAADAVAKLDLGPRSLNEIREQSIISSFLDSPSDRENRKQLAREKIDRGTDRPARRGCLVAGVDQPPANQRSGSTPSAKPTAFVYIETEGKRQLPYQTVQSIPGDSDRLRARADARVDHGDGTRGTEYFDSGNLAVGVASRNRAREEELVGKILDKLDWIKGVRVQVKVPAAQHRSSRRLRTVERRQRGQDRRRNALKSEPGGSTAGDGRQSTRDSLDPEPLPRLARGRSVGRRERTDANPPGGGHPGEHEKQPKHEPGRVLIYVPRSFYLNADIRADNREPTRDELRMRWRNGPRIRSARLSAWSHPRPSRGRSTSSRFPDEVSLNRPVIVQSPVDARRRVLDWGIVGTVVAVVSILAAVGSWIQGGAAPGGDSRSGGHDPALSCGFGVGTWTFGTGSRAGPP